jgi:hypothetical protein
MRAAPLRLFIHFGPSSSLAEPTDEAWWEATRSPRGIDAATRFPQFRMLGDQCEVGILGFCD